MNPATTTYVSGEFHYQPDPAIPAWNVSTYSHTYSGPITVQQATLQSDNTVYAQLTLDVGPQNVADMAHALGVQSPLEPVPSIGLGSNAVSPLDMASAYATLAAGGVYSKPMAIRKVILANGKADEDAGWGNPQRRRVISGRRRLHGDEDPRAERALRDRHARELRPSCRGEDRHDRRSRRRLVLRLPAEPPGDRLGRLPAGRDPDAERSRDRGRRRQLPGGDLAAVHGAGDAVLAGAGLPAPEDLSDTGRRGSRGNYDIAYQSASTSTSTTTTTAGNDPGSDDGRTDAADDHPRARRRRRA